MGFMANATKELGRFILINGIVLLLNSAGGIKGGQTCSFVGEGDYVYISDQPTRQEGYITCSDGTVITRVYSAKVSATGTPPHLMFSNYVGSYYPAQKNVSMPGSARKYIFFAGEPQLKDE